MLFTEDPYEDIMKAFPIEHKSENVRRNISDTNEDSEFTQSNVLGDIGRALVVLTIIVMLIIYIFIDPDKKEILFWIGMIPFSIGGILVLVQDYLEGD